MPEVQSSVPDTPEAERLAGVRSSVLDQITALQEEGEGETRLDIATDVVRILLEQAELTPQNCESNPGGEVQTINKHLRADLKPIPLTPALMEHIESEMGSIGNDEDWAYQAIVDSPEPFDNWDQLIWTESPEGKLIAVYVKYAEEGRVVGIKASEVEVL